MKECLCSGNGSLMAEIMAVIASGQFTDPKKSSGIFEVLEERMNPFEKAVYTIFSGIGDEIKSKAEQIKAGEITINLANALEGEIGRLRDKRSMLRNLLYFSIQDRLDRWNVRLGVSEGFKIIIPEEESCSCSHGIAIELPSGFAAGIEVLEALLSKLAGEANKKNEGEEKKKA